MFNYTVWNWLLRKPRQNCRSHCCEIGFNNSNAGIRTMGGKRKRDQQGSGMKNVWERGDLCSLNNRNSGKTWKWLVVLSCADTGNPLQSPTSFHHLSVGLIIQLQPVYLQSVAIFKMHCLWSVHCSDPSPCPQWQHYMQLYFMYMSYLTCNVCCFPVNLQEYMLYITHL